MNFVDVKTDFAFKKVFGSNGSKDLLISFLNSVIEFDQHQTITDLTIVDPYSIPLLKGMKDTYVDVKAELSDNTRVIIEMQILNHEGFEKRILYNAAKNYSMQFIQSDNHNFLWDYGYSYLPPQGRTMHLNQSNKSNYRGTMVTSSRQHTAFKSIKYIQF